MQGESYYGNSRDQGHRGRNEVLQPYDGRWAGQGAGCKQDIIRKKREKNVNF